VKAANPPDELVALWSHLSRASQEAVGEVIRLLAVDRYTGDINLECNEGGVRQWRESKTRRPKS
jgi:hypothetical protein